MTANEDLLDEPAAPDPTLTAGGLIAGKYRVERLLGMGGMGLVVAARHLDLDRPVAIKVVRQELAGQERILQRFLFEARSAAKIASEHVCKVIDVGRLENGLPYIVMEVLEGQDLGRVLVERGRIDPVECVDWMLQVCEGVAQAHAAGIVHRDLKPENLLLTVADGAPCVKILDFGISKQIGIEPSFTEPNGIVGSPRYMAPEQLLGGTVDERSDLWAIGAIAYELVTGVPAFSGDTVASVCAKVIGDTPVAPHRLAPYIPPGLDEVILRCLRRDRIARFPDAASLALALSPFASERGQKAWQRSASLPSSPPIPLVQRRTLPLPSGGPASEAPAFPTRRRRAGSALALLAALVGVAYGGLRWLGQRASTDAESRAPLPVPSAAPSATSGVLPASSAARDPFAPVAAKAERSATIDARALRPPGSATRSPPTSSSSRPPGAPPSVSRPTLASAKAAPSSSTAVDSESAAARAPSRSKLQEAWDIDNFGGRE